MMSPTPEPPFDSQPQGISLDELAEAFAQVMAVEPRRPAETPAPAENALGGAAELSAGAGNSSALAGVGARQLNPAADTEESSGAPDAPLSADEDSCPVNPRTILEAMLFVGDGDNRPLSPRRAAELMRDVEPEEIPVLFDELNRRYEAAGAPYHIVGEGDGYRLVLRPGFHPLRNRFYGRIHEARLSQAAIDVLALVAYQQPITAEMLGRLRGKPSSHVLAHLVRRGLLRIERPDPKRRISHYRTTDRFLKFFNLESLDDLPRSEDSGPP
jgi:segregation and condensation protein B